MGVSESIAARFKLHIFPLSAIVVWGIIVYPEYFLLHEEDFEANSHTQRLDVVMALGKAF